MASTNRSTTDNYYLKPKLTDEVVDVPFESESTFEIILTVVIFSVMFVIAAIGNLAVFVVIVRNKNKSQFDWLILHLAIADMIVTFLAMPMEVGWHLTQTFEASDVGCRVLMCLYMFGFYLSASIRAVICIDRLVSLYM